MKDAISSVDTILLGDITPTKKLILVETFIDLVVGKEIILKSPQKKVNMNSYKYYVVLEVFVYLVDEESGIKSYCVLLETYEK